MNGHYVTLPSSTVVVIILAATISTIMPGIYGKWYNTKLEEFNDKVKGLVLLG